MATTNYSLPTILGTNAFDLVTDYNALANATDAALASVAGLVPTEAITEMRGQISTLQTLTGSQGTQITTLQSQMTTANGNISTLQSGLETANNNIGTLQTGLQSANANITKNTQSINNVVDRLEMPIIHYVNKEIGTNWGGNLWVAQNSDKSLLKVYGNIYVSAETNRVGIPGFDTGSGSRIYGVPTSINIGLNEAHYFRNCVIRSYRSSGQVVETTTISGYCVGTDGLLYMYPSGSNTPAISEIALNILNQLMLIGNPATIVE